MHIFYAAPNTPHQTDLPASQIWRSNLFDSLTELGHQLTIFNGDYSEFNLNLDVENPNHLTFIRANRPLLSESLVNQVKSVHQQHPIDLFFSYFYSAYVEPSAIQQIGELGITTINWYCNASYQLNLVAEIAPAYHYCLVPEKFRLDDYRRIGANPIYCQEAANPTIYRPYDLPKDYGVTFVGQNYGDRSTFIRALVDAQIDVHAWGPAWQQPRWRIPHWREVVRDVKNAVMGRPSVHLPRRVCGAPLSDAEYVQMYSRSKISLGFSKVAASPNPDLPIKQVRLRDFEAPMSGAFYLVEYCDELTDFFEPDKEIVCFHTVEELVDKARYYLTHDSERETIRLAGMERARTEHTWKQRFQQVFREIGLSH